MNRNIRHMLILVIVMWIIVISAMAAMNKPADKAKAEPLAKPEQQQAQIIKVKATAFNEYGHDANGIDYGPGYVIISGQSEIPLYSLLDIDIYGPCQAVGVSPYLTKDEVKLWYNGTSKVTMFGTQTAYVRVLEKGDRPCQLNE